MTGASESFPMVSPRATQRAILTGLCLTLSLASHVRAEPTRNLGLRLDATCPSRKLVVSELSPLLRGYALNDDSAELLAEVEDLGESYRVSVAGASREVHDPARRCLERARVVAVFLALNLPASEPTAVPALAIEPPELDAEVKPALEAPPARAARAFELRPFASADSAWGAHVASIGVGLGASLRLGSMTITLLGAATTPTSPYQPSGAPPRFELRRWPFAALIGGEASFGMLGLGAEVGPALDVLGFVGKVVPNPDRALRINPGLRLNAVLRVRASRHLAAELLPVVSWFPRTYLVRVEPSQLLAETPRFWLGVALGLNYEIWGG
jgi:hypothetical protein